LRLSKVYFLLIFLILCGNDIPAWAIPVKEVPPSLQDEGFLAGVTPIESSQMQCVAGTNHGRVLVETVNFRQDSEAYELLSQVAAAARAKNPAVQIQPGYGTAGFTTAGEISFFKGTHFVRARALKDANADNVNTCAQLYAEPIDKGEGDIPALIKHLPSPEEAQKTAIFLNSFTDLNKLGLQQGVLTVVESGGNADAALAAYGPSKVLIVEFNTPQLAADNDRRIISRIQELWKLGQTAPAAYRRVGNYSVFVFDAPDEQTAKQLLGQVKYEQVVQWLGENPNIFKEAEKRYINTTLGVLVAVLKASGYAIVACFGLGGLFGGLLFTYRRSRQKAESAYSDAGGMLRLNLDDLTPETDPGRLLRERN
jgi:hypothetical protein